MLSELAEHAGKHGTSVEELGKQLKDMIAEQASGLSSLQTEVASAQSSFVEALEARVSGVEASLGSASSKSVEELGQLSARVDEAVSEVRTSMLSELAEHAGKHGTSVEELGTSLRSLIGEHGAVLSELKADVACSIADVDARMNGSKESLTKQVKFLAKQVAEDRDAINAQVLQQVESGTTDRDASQKEMQQQAGRLDELKHACATQWQQVQDAPKISDAMEDWLDERMAVRVSIASQAKPRLLATDHEWCSSGRLQTRSGCTPSNRPRSRPATSRTWSD
jgi:polyhydroxyalkanoate synthesis regulator phasin